MIGRLKGILENKKPPTVAINVGGVTYELDVSMNTIFQLPDIGAEVVLHTHLLIREDAHLLYGFYSDLEKEMFRVLLKVNGVGARTAMAVLGGMTAEELGIVVSKRDTDRLTMVPGIGKKTAERMVLELKDRVLPIQTRTSFEGDASTRDDVVAALLSLGYGEKEVVKVLNQIDLNRSLPLVIKEALKFFTAPR